MAFDLLKPATVPSLVPFQSQRQRAIDRDYHLALTAESVDQLKEIQAANFVVSAKAAKANLAALDEIREEHRESNRLLGSLLDAMDYLETSVTRVREAVEQQTEMQRQAFRILHDDLATIDKDLTLVAKQLLETHATLKNIEDVLRRPYETKVAELRMEAKKWLEFGAAKLKKSEESKHGAANTSSQQSDDFKEDFEDAFRLLEEIIKNPIGNQDYSTWFQIGWLRWKHYRDIPSAEQAFHRAVRLSAPQADEYHVLSLRHLAQMHYLLAKHEDAYQVMQRALVISRQHKVLLDAARYASRTGRNDEAIELLDACIDQQPTTIIEMYAEEDFQ